MRSSYERLRPARPPSEEILAVVSDCREVADLGCGRSSPLGELDPGQWRLGVDIHRPALEEARSRGTHDAYVQADVRAAGRLLKPDSCECVVLIDVIEHLDKEDGVDVLRAAEKVASRRVVVLTPNGFVEQKEYGENRWQQHRSGWSAEEMAELGYRVSGVNGLRWLRGRRAEVRLRPGWLGVLAADVSQPFVRERPELAYQLLCVKETGDRAVAG